jgi:hypothetical protein
MVNPFHCSVPGQTSGFMSAALPWQQGVAPHPAASRPGGGAGLGPSATLPDKGATTLPLALLRDGLLAQKAARGACATLPHPGATPAAVLEGGGLRAGGTSHAQPMDRPWPGDGSESRFLMGLEQDPFTHPSAEMPEAAPLNHPWGLLREAGSRRPAQPPNRTTHCPRTGQLV